MSRPINERSVLREIVPSIYATIGMIVVNWAFVESILSMWTAIAYSDARGDKLANGNMPRNFSDKVKYLRKCINSLPAFADEVEEMRTYVDRAKKLSNIRDHIVHGTLSDYDEANDEMFTFVKADVGKDKRQQVLGELSITGRDLVSAGNELLGMVHSGHLVTTRLVEAFKAENQ